MQVTEQSTMASASYNLILKCNLVFKKNLVDKKGCQYLAKVQWGCISTIELSLTFFIVENNKFNSEGCGWISKIHSKNGLNTILLSIWFYILGSNQLDLQGYDKLLKTMSSPLRNYLYSEKKAKENELKSRKISEAFLWFPTTSH